VVAIATEVELRGAPAKLMRTLQTYQGPRTVMEFVLHGGGGTGKSRGIGYVLLWLMDSYPGIRIIVTRKTRESLTDSFLKTWEEDVVPPGHPMLDGAARINRHSYTHPNGSELVLVGMDKPGRRYSTDYDVWYYQELFEGTEDEWMRARRALRNWGGALARAARERGDTEHPQIPFQLLIGDTNPDAEDHWINVRFKEGKTVSLQSRHEDNPALWDRVNKCWHPEGKAYIDSLESLKLSDEAPGVLYKRLRLGEWCSASGAVWSNYNRDEHEIDRPVMPVRDEGENDSTYARRCAGALASALQVRWWMGVMDWGHTDAGVFQVWGVTGAANPMHRRMYRVAEVYRTGQTIEWWGKNVVEMHREFGFNAIVCDPSRSDSIAAFNDYLGYPKEGPGRMARGANNAKTTLGVGDMSGLDLVRVGFQKLPDGKPAILLLRDSLRYGRDDTLASLRKPWRTEMEIPSYVYATNENGKPQKERTDERCADHGCDCVRYARSFAVSHDFSKAPSPIKFPPGSYGAAFGDDKLFLRKAG
jgi:hypothetical protein